MLDEAKRNEMVGEFYRSSVSRAFGAHISRYNTPANSFKAVSWRLPTCSQKLLSNLSQASEICSRSLVLLSSPSR
jgi:hypothetical protein